MYGFAAAATVHSVVRGRTQNILENYCNCFNYFFPETFHYFKMPGGSCRFCFTVNNWTEADIEWFHQSTIFKYICFGKEVGENLTPHLQGYFELQHGNRKSINACVKYLQDYGCPCKPHIEMAKGTALQAITYCQKEGLFWEKGDRPKGQGKRSDLDEATDLLSNGASMQDVAISHQYL